MSFDRRIVITGMGAVNSLGHNIPSFWNALKNGISGASLIEKFDTTHYKTKFACQVRDLNIGEHLDKRVIARSDKFTQLALIASNQAIKDSGIKEMDEESISTVGVIMGSGIGGLETFQDEVVGLALGDMVPRVNPFFIPKMIVDIAPGYLSILHGFMGPNYSSVSACASSAHALIDAMSAIRLNKADVMVTAGSEAVIYESGIAGFNALRALSTRNEDPKTASRPYDKGRDGFVMGEGAGSLVLEELEHAKKRGATIYAELVGTGMTADAYHLTAPHPEGTGAMRAMNCALQEAKVNTSQIDYINTHGTSTLLGDVSELKAISKLFKEEVYNMNISSSKSMTGHMLGAAGITEAIVAILSINNNLIPPTINHFEDDEEIDNKLNLTFNQAQEREVRTALSNTFGFGGHNACLIFQKSTS